MSKRSTLQVAAATLVVLGLCTLALRREPNEMAPPPPPGQSRPGPPAESAQLVAQQPGQTRTPAELKTANSRAAGIVKVHVSDEFGHPVVGALLVPSSTLARRVHREHAIAAPSNVEGEIAVTPGAHPTAQMGCVTALGYLPSSEFVASEELERRVVLSRGHAMALKCVGGEGRPIAGVRLELSMRPFPLPSPQAVPSQQETIPGLASKWALHRATSDPRGLATFSGLASGTYQLRCRKPYLVVDGPELDEIQVPVPKNSPIELELTEALAYAVEFQSAEMAYPSVRVRIPRYQREIASQVRAFKREYSARHPNAQLALTWDSDTSRHRATFSALDADGQRKHFKRTLLPLSQLAEPEIISVKPPSNLPSSCSARLKLGFALPGHDPHLSGLLCTLVFQRIDNVHLQDEIQTFSLGTSWVRNIPTGDYELHFSDRTLTSIVDPPKTIHIAPGTETFEVDISLRNPIYPVRLIVVDPAGDPIEPTKLRLSPVDGGESFERSSSTHRAHGLELSAGRYHLEVAGGDTGLKGRLEPRMFDTQDLPPIDPHTGADSGDTYPGYTVRITLK